LRISTHQKQCQLKPARFYWKNATRVKQIFIFIYRTEPIVPFRFFSAYHSQTQNSPPCLPSAEYG